MSQELFIAKRYAQAFLNVFNLMPEDVPKIRATIEFFEHHSEVFSLLKVPLLDASIKMKALEEYLLVRFKLPNSFDHLIALLISQKRSYLIVDVLRYLETMYQERQGIEEFEISSSTALTSAQITILEKFLSDRTHHTIVCNPVQDTTLIAGIRMQSGQHRWEYSIRKQLAKIRAFLAD